MNKTVGQYKLIKQLKSLIDNDTLPKFMIIVGERGSGRKFISKDIAKWLNATLVECSTKVNDIRDIINLAYKRKEKTVYTIYDADNMSLQAKNSLLKVTEEPPKNVYFIITLEDENNTLETIRSRGTVFHMDKYSPSEIGEYAESKYGKEDLPLYKDLCNTCGEVDLLHELNPQEFYDYVKKVVNHISTVSGANAFKIADKISLKDGDDGYDLILFWKCFSKVLFDTRTNMSGIRITDKYLSNLKIRGINKQMLFDEWLLDIRADWRKRYDNNQTD